MDFLIFDKFYKYTHTLTLNDYSITIFETSCSDYFSIEIEVSKLQPVYFSFLLIFFQYHGPLYEHFKIFPD